MSEEEESGQGNPLRVITVPAGAPTREACQLIPNVNEPTAHALDALPYAIVPSLRKWAGRENCPKARHTRHGKPAIDSVRRRLTGLCWWRAGATRAFGRPAGAGKSVQAIGLQNPAVRLSSGSPIFTFSMLERMKFRCGAG